MLKSISRHVTLAALVAAALAACDNGEPGGEQAGEPSGSPATADMLTGTLDRTFAGNALPGARVTDPSGTTLVLDELRGKPVLLNMWATWCAPCVVEMPLLNDLAGEMGERLKVVTVSVDLDGAQAVGPFFDSRGFDSLPRWFDGENELATAFGGGAVLPLTVLYDAEGEEVWRVLGAYDWESGEARDALREATAGEGFDQAPPN